LRESHWPGFGIGRRGCEKRGASLECTFGMVGNKHVDPNS
jgi:hypothetical protein